MSQGEVYVKNYQALMVLLDGNVLNRDVGVGLAIDINVDACNSYTTNLVNPVCCADISDQEGLTFDYDENDAPDE